MSDDAEISLSCPIPITNHEKVLLAHGGGGKLTHELLDKIMLPLFENPMLEQKHDGAVVDLNGTGLAFTTDSYVVKPLTFPGGDIGRLAVHGTVNDLAMCGAEPRYLSAGLIIEEGLAMETLWQIMNSMKQAAEEAGVQLVTGDTKVVDKGKADGIFINTAGIGIVRKGANIAPLNVQEGDAVILSGDVGRHGVAIMAQREGLEFESDIETDSADLSKLVMEILDSGAKVHCLRDCTRGGVATALVEIAQTAHLTIHVEEKAIPVREDVRGACEILGLDPLYIANEGRFLAFAPRSEAQTILDVMNRNPLGEDADVIGEVKTGGNHNVIIDSLIGAQRILDMFSGEQLPRIC